MASPTHKPPMCHVSSSSDKQVVVEDEDEETVPDLRECERPRPDGGEDIEGLPWHHAQLVMLYGRHVADDIMYPKMEKQIKSKTNPNLFGQEGHAGAAHLWSMLRNDSNGKLLKEDRKIINDLKESYGAFVRQLLLQKGHVPVKRNFYETEDVPDMEHLLQKERLLRTLDIRHKVELMGRSSKVNADKTGVLLYNNPLPDLVNSSGEEGIDRYLPSWIEEDASSIPSYRKWLGEQQRQTSTMKPSDSIIELTRPHGRDTARHQAPPKVKFLTEAEAGAEKGSFSNKYKEQRDSGHGVTNPVDLRRAVRMEELDVRPFRGDGVRTPSSSESRNRRQRPASTWEPLTLNALVEYSSSKGTQGAGNFSNGAVKMFPLTSEVTN